ncbi:hypothetical protein CTI12_AA365180 [Artemisia annua]|uniref:Uncharacterized protein n=1 Tax=Artemisia annua TaxID=35608 RepID=A0A2U1MM22_ARTAN|nr:hypothetical protein CTI12_AA365180 [Artemisia annua]
MQNGVLPESIVRLPKEHQATTLLELRTIRASHSKTLCCYSLGTAIGFRIRQASKEQLYTEIVDDLRGSSSCIGLGSQVASQETYGTLGAIVRSQTDFYEAIGQHTNEMTIGNRDAIAVRTRYTRTHVQPEPEASAREEAQERVRQRKINDINSVIRILIIHVPLGKTVIGFDLDCKLNVMNGSI